MAPHAASNPKAEPPESMTPCTSCTVLDGFSKSVSRVAGAAPRTSTPHTAPAGATTNVQPVPREASSADPMPNAGKSAFVAGANAGETGIATMGRLLRSTYI